MKIMLLSKTSSKLFKSLFAALALAVLPQLGFAYSSGGDAATAFVHNLCDYLSGDLAKAIGVLAIMGLGYRTLSGQVNWRIAAMVVLGMGMIMGGAHYGSVILGGN